MSTRLVSVVVDAADPPALARFWSGLTGWPVTHQDHEEVDVEGEHVELVFVPVADAKSGPNRLHLDLASTSLVAQQEIVARAVGLGALAVDIGQGDVPWTVLRDPEGNEFCVLEPRPEYADTGVLAAIVLRVDDPGALAPFWSETTGMPIIRETAELVSLRGDHGPWLELLRAGASKEGKNRLHIDVAPGRDDDHAAERDRLVRLGARPVDIGQGDVSWYVLADPEGNEFCILTPR